MQDFITINLLSHVLIEFLTHFNSLVKLLCCYHIRTLFYLLWQNDTPYISQTAFTFLSLCVHSWKEMMHVIFYSLLNL